MKYKNKPKNNFCKQPSWNDESEFNEFMMVQIEKLIKKLDSDKQQKPKLIPKNRIG